MEKVKINPFKVIGISIKTTNKNQQALQEIGELWGQFMEEQIMNHIPNKVNQIIYSLYTDYEGDHTKPYTAILGCEVENLNMIPKGMVGKSFEGGSYIKMTAAGDLTKGLIAKEWSKIWQMDLDRVYTVDYEIYDQRSQNINNAEVDILIGIK